MTTDVNGITITLTPEQIKEISNQQKIREEFILGTKVIIPKPGLRNEHLSWLPAMNPIVGKPGYITETRINKENHLVIKINFGDNFNIANNFWYSADWIELCPETITDKVKSWEDAANIVNPPYYLDSCGTTTFQENKVKTSKFDNSNVSSKARTKSVLAYCKLSVIADALNEGKEGIISVGYDKRSGLEYLPGTFYKETITFATTKLAEYSITQFPDLWYDYFMITK